MVSIRMGRNTSRGRYWGGESGLGLLVRLLSYTSMIRARVDE